MIIDLDQLSANQAYFAMTQTVIPRPVAWVLTEHDNGSYNVAPFSYFSAVCSDPPLLMFSVGHKPDGSLKDTYHNILQRKEFVVHIAGCDQAQAVTKTAKGLALGESELDYAGLETELFDGSPLPRIAGAPIAMQCELYEVKEIGNKPQFLVFGQVKKMFIADEAVSLDDKGRLKVSASSVNPLARLGGSDYVTFGDILTIPREL